MTVAMARDLTRNLPCLPLNRSQLRRVMDVNIAIRMAHTTAQHNPFRVKRLLYLSYKRDLSSPRYTAAASLAEIFYGSTYVQLFAKQERKGGINYRVDDLCYIAKEQRQYRQSLSGVAWI